MTPLRSRDNPRVRRWSRLVREAVERRREQRAVAEGAHLVAAALQHGWQIEAIMASESGLSDAEIAALVARSDRAPVVLEDRLFRATFDAQTPQGIAAELVTASKPTAQARPGSPWVFLEGVQDPGNVGAIIRSAAAFGAGAVVLDRQCADPWSPKALRGGMGGHFALAIVQCAALESAIREFNGTVLATVSAQGQALRDVALEGPVGWLFGSEGGGLSPALQGLAAAHVSIPIQAGTESLNVAAAAAICLYETAMRHESPRDAR